MNKAFSKILFFNRLSAHKVSQYEIKNFHQSQKLTNANILITLMSRKLMQVLPSQVNVVRPLRRSKRVSTRAQINTTKWLLT